MTVMEYADLEGIHQDYQVQFLALSKIPKNHPVCLRVLSEVKLFHWSHRIQMSVMS